MFLICKKSDVNDAVDYYDTQSEAQVALDSYVDSDQFVVVELSEQNFSNYVTQ